MVDGVLLPGNRMVGSQHHLACTDLSYEMAQAFRREHHGIEIELVEVLRWLLLQRDVCIAILRRHETGMIATCGIRTEIAAAMCGDDLEPREAVERAFEDQMLQGDGGVERVTDGVRQPAIALEALGEFRRALRMDEEHRAELLCLGPDRMEFGIREVLSQHAATDRGAAQALLPNRSFQLLHRKIGKLQRE